MGNNLSEFMAFLPKKCMAAGVVFPVGRLLCLEYQSAHKQSTKSMQFIFNGGILENNVEISTEMGDDV